MASQINRVPFAGGTVTPDPWADPMPYDPRAPVMRGMTAMPTVDTTAQGMTTPWAGGLFQQGGIIEQNAMRDAERMAGGYDINMLNNIQQGGGTPASSDPFGPLRYDAQPYQGLMEPMGVDIDMQRGSSLTGGTSNMQSQLDATNANLAGGFDWGGMFGSLLGIGGNVASGLAGGALANRAIHGVEQFGQQANTLAQQVGDEARTDSEFKPFTVTSNIANTTTTPEGGINIGLTPQQQAMQNSLFSQAGQAAGSIGGGIDPSVAGVGAQAGQLAGQTLGSAGQDPALTAQRSQLQSLFSQTLGQPTNTANAATTQAARNAAMGNFSGADVGGLGGMSNQFGNLTGQSMGALQGGSMTGNAAQQAMMRNFGPTSQGGLGGMSQQLGASATNALGGLGGNMQAGASQAQLDNISTGGLAGQSSRFGQAATNALGALGGNMQAGASQAQLNNINTGGLAGQSSRFGQATIDSLGALGGNRQAGASQAQLNNINTGGLTGQSAQFGQATTDALGRLNQDQSAREQSLFNDIRATQAPDEERARLQLEQRLNAQGRGGVRTSMFGGTPEQLAMEKAQAEARNSAALGARSQAATERQQALGEVQTMAGLTGSQAQQLSQLESAGVDRATALGQMGMAQQAQDLNRTATLAGLTGSQAQQLSQLESAGVDRATALGQMGMSQQAQDLNRTSTLAGLSGSQAQQLSQLQSMGVDRATALGQMGISQQAQDLNSVNTLTGLTGSTAQQLSQLESMGVDRATALGQLGLSSEAQDLNRTSTLAGLTGNTAQQVSQLESMGVDRATALAGLGLQGTAQEQQAAQQKLQSALQVQSADQMTAQVQQALEAGDIGRATSLFEMSRAGQSAGGAVKAQDLQNLRMLQEAGYAPNQQALSELSQGTNVASIADIGRRTGAQLGQQADLSGLEALIQSMEIAEQGRQTRDANAVSMVTGAGTSGDGLLGSLGVGEDNPTPQWIKDLGGIFGF